MYTFLDMTTSNDGKFYSCYLYLLSLTPTAVNDFDREEFFTLLEYK